MGIWNRLGNVLKSYVNDSMDHAFGEKPFKKRNYDDDYNDAYEELEGFLRGEKPEANENFFKKNEYRRPVPNELRPDFAELGLSPGATETECRDAYKKLLKIHHPDKHSGDPEKIIKATEKTAKINAAYDRLVKWFKMT